MTDWAALTARTLAGLERCDPIYRPTNFWSPGVRRLLDDLQTLGLDSFKSWPMADTWFYPTYGSGLTAATIESTYQYAVKLDARLQKGWLTTTLAGGYQARRDFDAVRLTWDQARWPFDLERLGESAIGKPAQIFRLTPPSMVGWTRPYLNYLLCLAALSRHVDGPPQRFLEIGGGYGVLGEILMSRDPDACYVDLDLPPLLTVASFYLDALFDGRVAVFDDAVAETGPIRIAGSACLPNWRIGDIAGPFDVFFNSFSFQEMEPDVVEHYIGQVAAKDVAYVVSLNSRLGKPMAADDNDIGVIDPVTSGRIIGWFEAAGYELLERSGDPLIQSAGEVAILRRKGVTARPAAALAARPTATAIDHRADPPARPSLVAQRPTSRLGRFAREWVPPKILRGARRVRARLR